MNLETDFGPRVRPLLPHLMPAILALAFGALALSPTGAGARQVAPAKAEGGRIVYLKTQGTYPITTVWDRTHSWVVNQTEIVERWIAPDGSGRQHTVVPDAPRFASAADRRTWEEAGRPPFLAHGFHGHSASESLPPGSFYAYDYDASVLAALPHSPDGVRAWLEAEAKRAGGEDDTFDIATRALGVLDDLLQNPYASEPQRKALVGAAEEIEGTRKSAGDGRVTITSRSSGSGIDLLYTLTYSQAEARLLSSKTRTPDSSAAAPREKTFYLAQGRVDALGDRP